MSPRLRRILDGLVHLVVLDAPLSERVLEAEPLLDELNDVYVTPEKIQTLRERSGLGILECKRVLEELDGDLETALTLHGRADNPPA